MDRPGLFNNAEKTKTKLNGFQAQLKLINTYLDISSDIPLTPNTIENLKSKIRTTAAMKRGPSDPISSKEFNKLFPVMAPSSPAIGRNPSTSRTTSPNTGPILSMQPNSSTTAAKSQQSNVVTTLENYNKGIALRDSQRPESTDTATRNAQPKR